MTHSPAALKPVKLVCRIFKSTDKAVFVHQGNPANAVWLPRSQITLVETGERINGHAVADLTLPQWLAKEHGLMALPPKGPDMFAPTATISDSEIKGGALAREAAMMCNEGAFAVFLGVVDSASVVAELKRRCNIQSRAELDHKPMAAAAFKNLKLDYEFWMHT